MHKLKSILALFALLVFLLPQVEKEIHNHQHSTTVHCADHHVVHFHNVEHQCFLCDLKQIVTSSPADLKWATVSLPSGSNIFLKAVSFGFRQAVDMHLLRAPPSLA